MGTSTIRRVTTAGMLCALLLPGGCAVETDANVGAEAELSTRSPCYRYYSVIAACGATGAFAGGAAYCTGGGTLPWAAATIDGCLAAWGITDPAGLLDLAKACGVSLLPAPGPGPITGHEGGSCHADSDPGVECAQIVNGRTSGGTLCQQAWSVECELAYQRCVSVTTECLVDTLLSEAGAESATCALPSDLNADGATDGDDVAALMSLARTTPGLADMNEDGRTDLVDRDTLVHEVLGVVYGDADLNGTFESADLVSAFAAGHYDRDEPARWATGDWDGDGRFDSSDLVLAFSDGGYRP